MPKLSRRDMIQTALAGSALAASAARADVEAIALPAASKTPADNATNRAFWRAVADQFDVTDMVIQLENGNWGIMARPVLDAFHRHTEKVNRENSYWRRPNFVGEITVINDRVADALGVTAQEIALTRGATEALQNLITGYNLLKPGDGVLYADVDYFSMKFAMNWLETRRGASIHTLDMPEPATHQGIIDAYEQALNDNPHIRLVLLTHLNHLTGIVLPVREIAEMARARDVDVIVDAAHSWGQLDFEVADLGADFIGFNLHKWIGAPIGAGVMYVSEDRIADIDPYMADTSYPEGDIRLRVHTGTSNYGTLLTIPDALDFHDLIGIKNKEPRLRYLRSLWVDPLRDHPELEILTPADPRLHGGITSFRIKGRTSDAENIALAKELLDRFNIFTVYRTGIAKGACIRVTPALFTQEEDVQALVPALQAILEG